MIVQLIITFPAIAHISKDTNGIYFTKSQFEKNELQLKSLYWIKEKGPILWSDFAYEVSSSIKLKISKEKIKTFTKGSIYGFEKDGIKFINLKSINEYLAVLYNSPSFCLFVKEDNFFLYHQPKSVAFLYAKNLDSPLKKFNKQNIIADFSDNLVLEKKLVSLYKQVDREKTYFPHKDFFKWEMKIENYLK